jgi:hypothetical protein
MHSQDVRAASALCPARFLFFFQKLMREGVTEFFFFFSKEKSPAAVIVAVYIYG